MTKLFLCDYNHCKRYGKMSKKYESWRDANWVLNRKKWCIFITVRNIQGVYQTKYYYGSVKKSTSSSSCNLQIDKKINNVKEDSRRKTSLNFDFSQAASCLWGFNMKDYYVVHIIELFKPKEVEIGR